MKLLFGYLYGVLELTIIKHVQKLATRLVTGIRHLPYEERLQLLGLHSLQRRRIRADLNTTFKIFTGLLNVNSNLSFLPPTRRGFRGHPYKVLQGTSLRRRGGVAFSVRASVDITPSVNTFKTRLERVWAEVFTN